LPNLPRSHEFKIDPARLPPVTIAIGAHLAPETARAVEALARADFDACIAASRERPLTGESRVLALVAASLAYYSKGDFAGCETVIGRFVEAAGPNPFMILLDAVCRERQGLVLEADSRLVEALAAATGQGGREEFDAILVALGRHDFSALSDPTIVMAGFGMTRIGSWQRRSAVVRARLPAFGAAAGRGLAIDLKSATRLLVFFGLSETRFPDWQDAVFASCAMPMITSLIATGRIGLALALEPVLFELYVKTREVKARHKFALSNLVPAYADAGRRRSQVLPPLMPIRPRDVYKVAFVASRLSELAHTITTLDTIACLHAVRPARLACSMIGLHGADTRFLQRCASRDVPTHTISESPDVDANVDKLLIELRSFIAAEGFDAVIWVSTSEHCAFAFALPLAPVQIFLSLKFHEFAMPEIDGYLTTGAVDQDVKTIDGRPWRTGRPMLSGLFAPELAARAAGIRADFGPDKIVLGSIGREAKFDSPEFLAAVAALLSRHPNAIFAWTGRTKLASIEAAFDRAGVSGQCRFLGWVDTVLYAQVIDIFLDSFPFPCGHTVFQAMAARKPVVFFDSEEARESGVAMYIDPVLERLQGSTESRERISRIFRPGDDDLFFLARNSDQYVGLAESLIVDRDQRERVGGAMAAFVEEFMGNELECGRSFTRHIVEVIEDKAALEHRA
jgi:glycosyltransferase involved in cell wall biosynthesis